MRSLKKAGLLALFNWYSKVAIGGASFILTVFVFIYSVQGIYYLRHEMLIGQFLDVLKAFTQARPIYRLLLNIQGGIKNKTLYGHLEATITI